MSKFFENEPEGCPFCDFPKDRTLAQNELAFVLRDRYPVTPLHALVIPKRHVSGWFDLGTSEMKACNDLLLWAKDAIREEDASVAGFNVGINIGEAAGQTIFHCHIHLIPRRRGDVENPRGGVRHVIPWKGTY
ncbi:MAG: HIT domain-containing protein [Deltaproteobacteria bacterium]|nr:HIT domain-containing protein [Deltaproteobacteria bacterium]